MTARAGTRLPFIDGRQACASVDPEMFFAPAGVRGPERDAREEAAKAVCAPCPLLAACRDHALAHAEWGVWGGLSEDDRVRLQRRLHLPRRIGPPRTSGELRRNPSHIDLEELT